MKRNQHSPLRNAGAELITRSEPLDVGGCVVLAEVSNSPQPFVTWIEDEEGFVYWGHYFETLPEAQKDFATRAAQSYRF